LAFFGGKLQLTVKPLAAARTLISYAPFGSSSFSLFDEPVDGTGALAPRMPLSTALFLRLSFATKPPEIERGRVRSNPSPFA